MAVVFLQFHRTGWYPRCGKSSSHRIREHIPGILRGRAHPGPGSREPMRISFRYYEFESWISLKDGAQCFRIEMIRVVVRGGGDIGKREPGRIDHQLRHSDVRLVGLAVLFG